LRKPKPFRCTTVSFEVDWLGAYKNYVNEPEAFYHMFSVTVGEAINLRNKGSERNSLQLLPLASELCDRLAARLDSVLCSMIEHCQKYGTAPSTSSQQGKFLRKIRALRQMVAGINAAFSRVAVSLTSPADTAPPDSSWASLDDAHYDMNACVRESLLMLKSFLRVLSAEELSLFQATLLKNLALRSRQVRATSLAFTAKA
jgi:hypothetical protein